ncbi:MAG TPA: hypothetical protein VFD42_09255 [Chloroflexota bacterium]|nr:hypothetical protein [Chloroflexota bacterium]
MPVVLTIAVLAPLLRGYLGRALSGAQSSRVAVAVRQDDKG